MEPGRYLAPAFKKYGRPGTDEVPLSPQDQFHMQLRNSRDISALPYILSQIRLAPVLQQPQYLNSGTEVALRIFSSFFFLHHQ